MKSNATSQRKIQRLLATALAVLLVATATFLPVSAAAPPAGAPTGVNGRILTPAQSGDISNWVEIAQYNGSSLIIRADYIRISGYRNYDPEYNYFSFGTDNKYSNSFLRARINHWFAGVPDYANWEDVLPLDARLRDYTLQHNALSKLGTCNTIAAMSDGLSAPYSYQVGIGADIAFALSYGESANFLSTIHFQRNNSLADQPSNAVAVSNVQKINIPYNYLSGMWLRSPGDVPNTVGALDNEGNGRFRAFQFYVTSSASQKGYIYPALWVDSAIFGPTDYTVTYYPNGGEGSIFSEAAAPNSDYTVKDQGYVNAGYAFAGWNTEPDGSGAAYQNSDIIKITGDVDLYAQWTKIVIAPSIVYHFNLYPDDIFVDYGDNGIFTIKPCMFTAPLTRHFYIWSTTPQPDDGALLPPGVTFDNFNGTLHLYAIWLIETVN